MLVFYLATSMCGLSVNTVQCLVYRSGVVYKGLKKKEVVKAENRRKQLPWCLEKRRWVVDGNWNKVIFSDGSQIVMGTNNGIYLP